MFLILTSTLEANIDTATTCNAEECLHKMEGMKIAIIIESFVF